MEPVNRAIFKANVAADHAVMKPVAQAYSDHVPEGVQKGIHNVVQNLKEPAVAVNDALQGNVKQAWQSVQRLAVNSTAGVAGIFDVADKLGIPPHKADFGQTLAVWGVGEGPFVELPLLGPSNARDAVGTVVDPVLESLEMQALAASPSLRSAVARVDEARALARLTRSQFFPEISLDPSARRERTSGNLPTMACYGADNPGKLASPSGR